jgi:hypothetical protein
LEYKDKNAKLDLGDIRSRRKGSITARTVGGSIDSSSPHFKNFMNSFQDAVKKKEDEQKREQVLSNTLSSKEFKETKSKLEKLGMCKWKQGY